MNLIIVNPHWIPSPILKETQEKNNNQETIAIDINVGHKSLSNKTLPVTAMETSSIEATT
jgi:hypothetical protein